MSTPLVLIEEGLFQLLKANTALMALVGANGIFLNAVPESATDPAFCFSDISSTPDTTMDGPSGLNFRRYQFDCFSSNYPQAVRVRELIRQAIDGYNHEEDGPLPNGQICYNIIRDNELSGFNDATSEHRAMVDYFVHFDENPVVS